MHWLKCSLLATILCAAYCQNLETQTVSTTDGTEVTLDPKENEVNLEANPNVTQNVAETQTNATSSQTDVQISLKSGQEPVEVENATFNDIKPLLFFPILPFLFPPREDESLTSTNDKFSIQKNENSSKDGENPSGFKPFIFFDFAFNIRRIPINNATDSLNDSKIINVKKLSMDDSDDRKGISRKNRRRRNTKGKLKTPGFFADSPLFPDSEFDEFLPKPDLFFPDLPFHEKPLKKLSRRKRDRKKIEFKNDLKSFFDAFDEAFMRTKRELEWVDPILNFLRGGEQAFSEEKKEADNLFGQVPQVQEKPTKKWRIQRNIKRLNGDRQGGPSKAQDSPTIIVDKVVKIGEFHVHDDEHDRNKSKKKRDMSESRRKFLRNHGEKRSSESNEGTQKHIFELIKEEESQKKSRNHPEKSAGRETPEKTELMPQNVSFVVVEQKNAQTGIENANANAFEKHSDIVKMFDSLKNKLTEELTTAANKDAKSEEELDSKKDFRDTLRRNITELIRQFLMISRNLDDAKLLEKLEASERDDGKAFDWTEKETLENSNALGKGSKEGRRQKKDAYFEDEYVNLEKKERQVADLNYLFLNVTLPTVFVFAFVLFVCFFSLQVKGKICTKLFRPRQVFIVNDEASTQLKSPMRNSGVKKIQNI